MSSLSYFLTYPAFSSKTQNHRLKIKAYNYGLYENLKSDKLSRIIMKRKSLVKVSLSKPF